MKKQIKPEFLLSNVLDSLVSNFDVYELHDISKYIDNVSNLKQFEEYLCIQKNVDEYDEFRFVFVLAEGVIKIEILEFTDNEFFGVYNIYYDVSDKIFLIENDEKFSKNNSKFICNFVTDYSKLFLNELSISF